MCRSVSIRVQFKGIRCVVVGLTLCHDWASWACLEVIVVVDGIDPISHEYEPTLVVGFTNSQEFKKKRIRKMIINI